MTKEKLPIFDLEEGLRINFGDYRILRDFHDECYFQSINHRQEVISAFESGDFAAARDYSYKIYEPTLFACMPSLRASGKQLTVAMFGHSSKVSLDDKRKLGLDFIEEVNRFVDAWPSFRESQKWPYPD